MDNPEAFAYMLHKDGLDLEGETYQKYVKKITAVRLKSLGLKIGCWYIYNNSSFFFPLSSVVYRHVNEHSEGLVPRERHGLIPGPGRRERSI